MYDIASIITHLQNNTNYTINQAKTKEPVLSSIESLPIIYVGYGSLDSRNPTTPVRSDIIAEHGEDLTQSFELQINCMVEDLHTVHSVVFRQLIGKNFSSEYADQQSGFAYKQGGVIGLENGRIWWLDIWHLAYPTLYMFP